MTKVTEKFETMAKLNGDMNTWLTLWSSLADMLLEAENASSQCQFLQNDHDTLCKYYKMYLLLERVGTNLPLVVVDGE